MESFQQRLMAHQPRLKSQPSRVSAAVCVMLRERAGQVEFLLMQRAEHKDDPWSGQMGFPGGKIESTDASPQAAAERETLEEVGVDVKGHRYLGRLNDVYGFKHEGTYIVHLSSFVYWLHGDVIIRPNYEVAETVWLPLNALNDPQNYYLYPEPRLGIGDMPSVRIDLTKSQILWGLTLRIVVHLADVIGAPFGAFESSTLERIRAIEANEH